MLNTVNAEVSLEAVRHNLAVVRVMCPACKVLAVVKADAYGHGLIPVAKSLGEADGLAVARLPEALLLRQAGITQRVVLFGTLLGAEDLAQCSQLNIDVVVHDQTSMERVIAEGHRSPLRVWLKLDSGMHRVGFDTKAFIRADSILSRHPGIIEIVHMTHLSDVEHDETTTRQIRSFWDCHSSASGAEVSIANSGAIILRPEAHAGWVRPGIMLYGENPLSSVKFDGLKAAMELKAPVIAIREIERGDSVGYNRRWQSERPSRIGTVGIGYADGYPRHAVNGTPVSANGRLVPIVGQISMDSLTIDLTDSAETQVGHEITLWGESLAPSVIAKYAGTISYDLLSGISARVPREYHR
jgi:alanine racemase